MKKTLSLVLLTGLMLTGCGGQQAAVQSAETATAVAAVEVALTLPDVMGLTLDKATDQLEDPGFEVEAVDTVEGKSILVRKNWQVTSQDPAGGASLAKGSTVKLGVTSLDKLAADKAAADQAAAQQAADQAAQAAAAQAAAEQAARDAAARQAVPAPAPAPAPAAPAPSSVYFGSCADAKAAGAAPLYSGQPGYRAGLDRDRDGVACES